MWNQNDVTDSARLRRLIDALDKRITVLEQEREATKLLSQRLGHTFSRRVTEGIIESHVG